MYLNSETPPLEVGLAESAEDIAAVQRLRYQVFVQERGADGPDIDHTRQREQDRFDAFSDHLLVCDPSRGSDDRVVGTYRLITSQKAALAGGFYSAAEYDLGPLLRSGLTLLELGRSCLLPEYRGGTALLHLWRGIGRYVAAHNIDVLFGVASFSGVDMAGHLPALSLLHHDHLTPENLRVTARGEGARDLKFLPAETLDRRAAMMAMPPLIKAYLRLGGTIGSGVYVDHDFKTTDVCLILQADHLTARQRALYGGDDAS